MLTFEKIIIYSQTYDFGRHIRLVIRIKPDPANTGVYDWKCLVCNRPGLPALRDAQIGDTAPIFYEGPTEGFMKSVDMLIESYHGNMPLDNWKKLDSAWRRFKKNYSEAPEELPQPDASEES